MNTSTTVEWLSKAIAKATRSAKFRALGCLLAIDPGIEVEGLGAIRLPLNGRRRRNSSLIVRSHRTERERRRWLTRE